MSTLFTLETDGADRFVAPEAPERGGRMFGGQLLGQALVAAAATCGSDRTVHSVHAHFLRAGAVDEATTIDVERVRDGRSFTTRATSTSQGGRELFRATWSFHVPEPGLDHEGRCMPDVPEPDDVATTYADFVRSTAPALTWDGAARPMEIRYVDPPPPDDDSPIVASQKTWLRMCEPMRPDDAVAHAAGLVYLSDATLIDHALLPHGRRWHDPRLDGASLDHAMWLHVPARCDEWLLFDQRVERTAGARGTCSGSLYRTDGVLVATCVQEGLIRWRDDRGAP